MSAAGDAGNNQETGEHQAQHSDGNIGSPASDSIGSPTKYADGSYRREYEETPCSEQPVENIGLDTLVLACDEVLRLMALRKKQYGFSNTCE